MPKYRSKFEARVAEQLKSAKMQFKYESEVLEYTSTVRGGKCFACGSKDVHKHRKYTPDFILYPKKGGKVYLEVKGRLASTDRTKMIDVLKAHPKIDLYMVLQRDNKIRGSFKYSDWCKKSGIKFYIGDVKELCLVL